MVPYHSYHVGLGGVYMLGEILKSSYGGQATNGWDHFLWGQLTPQDTM